MKLHVERTGDGPDLVLLHGWALHSGAWKEALPALARRFRVHAVELPGHGFSAAVPARTFDDAAELVAGCVPQGAVVCGWSLGGLFAQRIARDHPRRVGALALVSTTPCFMQREDWPHAMMPSTLATFAAGLHSQRDRTLRDFVHLNALHGALGREAVRAFTARLAERGSASLADLQASLDWLRRVDLRPGARGISCPTLVAHGGRDALVPIAAGRWLAAAIPSARLVQWDDAAHLPFFTHRDAFVEALESLVA